MNKENGPKGCKYDYRFRFLCCRGCKYPYMTKFYDRDDPNGVGDYETLTDLIKEGNPICPNPFDVLCQTVAGAPSSSTG